jgi:hypothetical protein
MIDNNLPQMLTLKQLADYRYLMMIKFRVEKHRLELSIANKGASPELDDMIVKCRMLLDTIEEIDQSIREYFCTHGRLN